MCHIGSPTTILITSNTFGENMNSIIKKSLGLALSSILLLSCSDNHHASVPDTEVIQKKQLVDFENKTDTQLVILENASSKIVTDNNNSALFINLASASHHNSSFTIKPADPWDFSQYKNVALTIDIANPSTSSAHLYIYTHDTSGASQLRSTVVPANSQDTYLIELKVPSLDINTGIRNNPMSWKHDFVQTIWRGGVKQPDVSAIEKVRILISGVLEDKQLQIDNLKVIEPIGFDKNFLTAIVDKFGQNAKQDFERKVNSVEELKSVSEKEQKQLQNQPIAGRSKFNGWANGPKLEATGYFRTEKYQGKWTLVDPQGYLFFSNGIANIRMANTSTITGYDFDTSLIKQRDPTDYTPEDSIGLNRAPDKAIPTRYISSPCAPICLTGCPVTIVKKRQATVTAEAYIAACLNTAKPIVSTALI